MLELSSSTAVFLMDVAVKSAVLLGLAGICAAALRRAPAALRHWVWSLALFGSLTLPVLSVLLPSWSVPGLATWKVEARSSVQAEGPRGAAGESGGAVHGADDLMRPLAATAALRTSGDGPDGAALTSQGPPTEPRAQRGSGELVSAAEPSSTAWLPAIRSRLPGFPLGVGLMLAWFAGFALLGVRLLRALRRTHHLGLDASSLTAGEAARVLAELRLKLGISRRVALLESPAVRVPMTWGVLRPRVLLPAAASDWPKPRLQAVLLHELAHVRRLDYLTQQLARLACALYWFNPLVWLAAARLRVERELACDDHVLRAGSRPTDYAGHLVAVARSLKSGSPASLAAVAMARSSQIGDRVLALLDRRRARWTVTARMKLAAALTAFAVVSLLASAGPSAAEAEAIPPRDTFDGGVAKSPNDAPEGSTLDHPRPGLDRRQSRDLDEQQPVARGSRPELAVQSSELACGWFESSGSSSTSINVDDDRWRIRLSRGDCDLEIDISGELTFNDDFTRLTSLSPDGEIEIEEEHGDESRRVRIEAERSGELSYRWFVNGRERTYDEAARAWLSEVLLVLFRRGGFKAEGRAAHILERQGVDGLLAEIALIPSDHTARRYYTVLLSRSDLEPEKVREIVRQVARDIESDHELARLLVAIAENQPVDEAVRIAYVEAAGTIDSDHEHRRVLSAILGREGLSHDMTRSMLGSATQIDSDHELSRLLREILERRPLEEALVDAFFAAVRTLDSDHEQRRVLETALAGGPTSPRVLDMALETAAEIDSDHEISRLLQGVADRYPVDREIPPAYLAAARSIDSDHELRRVLEKLAGREGLSSGSLQAVLELAAEIESDHELASLLERIAGSGRLDRSTAPAFFRAVETLGSDHARRRVLTEVTRDEPFDEEMAERVLDSALGIDSDHQLATVLGAVADRIAIGDRLRPAFMRAVNAIGSEHQREKVLSKAFPGGSFRM